ncbi:MAG: FAD-dependent oxidoreductase [Kofleriaceae bacterium]
MLREVEVAIIGGGFAGCATAWALAARGVSAVVLEREPDLGRQASGRGAGLGRQLAEDDATSALVIRGAALLRERFADAWSATGGILSFDDPQQAQTYISRARRLAVAHQVIDRARVVARWPILAEVPIAAAVLVERDGVIDIRRLLAGYARDLDIVHAEVTAIAEGRLETTRGSVTAKVVVDAAGAWSGIVAGDPPLESLKRHLFVVESPLAPGASAPFVWHLGGGELYVRADAGGTLASPCDAEPTEPIDQVASPDADARLHARFGAAFADAAITRRWACQRAFTADRQMRIGRDPRRPWLVWAAGLGGHGATASAAVGELAATAVIEALASAPRSP